MATQTGTRSALLIVDVQVGVVAQAWERERVVNNMAAAVDKARSASVPVVWVQHQNEELVPDSAAWQWVPELRPAPDELHVHKQFNSAFEGTQLLAELQRLDVGRVFLAGAATNWCIRATAYAALDKGFDVTLISDAHTTDDMEVEPGRVVHAREVVDDLNVALRWLKYPGRSNAAVPVLELAFAT